MYGWSIVDTFFYFLLVRFSHSNRFKSVLFTRITVETIDSFLQLLALIHVIYIHFSVVLCFQPAHHTHQQQVAYTISRIQVQHQNHKCGQQPAQIAKILVDQKVVLYQIFNA